MSLLTKLDAIVAHGKHVPSEAYHKDIDKALDDKIDVVRGAAIRQKKLRGF